VFYLRAVLYSELFFWKDMYVDAVEKILHRLREPKLKQSKRQEMLESLKGIDPHGSIADFVSRGKRGDRPDMQHLKKFEDYYGKKFVCFTFHYHS
jgi:hypothetical protein